MPNINRTEPVGDDRAGGLTEKGTDRTIYTCQQRGTIAIGMRAVRARGVA